MIVACAAGGSRPSRGDCRRGRYENCHNTEPFVVAAGHGSTLWNLLEQRVTSEAPAKWLGQVEKVEAPEYLKQLCPRFGCPDKVAPNHLSPL